MTTITRLGDMINALTDPNLSRQERDDIVRQLNELGTREEKYKSWLQFAGPGARLSNPLVHDPNWRTSPLHVFTGLLPTDTSIPNNTYTFLTFDSGVGDVSVFDFYNGDKSKIRVDRAQINVHIDGGVNWDSNATGFREAVLDVFNAADVSLASQILHKLPAAPTNASIPISITFNILSFFPDAAYARLKVAQNSGGNLLMTNTILSFGVA